MFSYKPGDRRDMFVLAPRKLRVVNIKANPSKFVVKQQLAG